MFTRRATILVVAVFAGLSFNATKAVAQYPPLYPQQPIFISPPQISINPFTGGLNTQGLTVNNTALDPFREMSKNIPGNVRPVNRPLSGGGWETGTEWYNPVTGQWHGNTNQIRPNGLGGVNNQNVIRSVNPNASRPR